MVISGRCGLRSFIAKRVDRLDDIISDEIFIRPVAQDTYHKLIDKRLEYYRLNREAEFPLGKEVFDYLYEVANGRLRYIFGMVYALVNRLHAGQLVQKISLSLAKDTVAALAKERMQKFNLSQAELETMNMLAEWGEGKAADLAKHLQKNRSFISRIINKFVELKLVTVRQEGLARIYTPSIDARIAFKKVANVDFVAQRPMMYFVP